jgi:hypothetical protein
VDGEGVNAQRGIVTIAQGENARNQAKAAIGMLRRVGCEWPVAVIADQPLEGALGTTAQHIYAEDRADDPGARWPKVNLDRLSPFDWTLYMDADTRAMSVEIGIGFDLLGDGWELVITPSANQGDDWLWHVGAEEREATESEYGARVVVLQGGVFWFRKCEAVTRLFEAWRAEWLRYRGQDQAALLRAVRQAPVKRWLLGRPFNGGSVVKHLFKWARRD